MPSAAEIARSYLESFATADPKKISAHVSEDFVNEHTSALGSGCTSKAVYEERLNGFLGDMEGLRYEIEDLVASGDTVVAFYCMKARWQATAPIEVRGVQRLIIEDGLIAHRTDYWDSASFLKQAVPEAAEALAPFIG